MKAIPQNHDKTLVAVDVFCVSTYIWTTNFDEVVKNGFKFFPKVLDENRTTIETNTMLRPKETQKVIDGWLVVSTPLKNISQNGNLPQIGVKIKDISKLPPRWELRTKMFLFTCEKRLSKFHDPFWNKNWRSGWNSSSPSSNSRQRKKNSLKKSHRSKKIGEGDWSFFLLFCKRAESFLGCQTVLSVVKHPQKICSKVFCRKILRFRPCQNSWEQPCQKRQNVSYCSIDLRDTKRTETLEFCRLVAAMGTPWSWTMVKLPPPLWSPNRSDLTSHQVQ